MGLSGHAAFDGVTYRLVEVVCNIETGEQVVICESNDGKRGCVALAHWNGLLRRESASYGSDVPRSEPAFGMVKAGGSLVTSKGSKEEKIALFKSLFRGRDDAYAKSYFSKKRQKLEYLPACDLEWRRPVCKKPSVRCSACKHRRLSALSDAVMLKHLGGTKEDGSDQIGLYPLFDDSMTWLLVADFDGEGWKEEIAAYKSACAELGVSAYVERSRSGNGGHAWVFFEEPVKAVLARAVGFRAVTLAMEKYYSLPFSAYDRFFPNQDVMPQGGFGNLIALPLQRMSVAKGNSVFIDDDFVPFSDQWAFLSQVTRVPLSLAESLAPGSEKDALIGALSRQGAEGEPWETVRTSWKDGLESSGCVRVVLADRAYVAKERLSCSAVNAVRRLAAFANPAYYRAQAMRQSLRGIPRVIYEGEDADGFIGLPRGCTEGLFALFDGNGIEYAIEDKRVGARAINVSFKGSLRAEQEEAARNLLEHDTGVLHAATGFGKTVVGAYLIAERKVNTLVLVNSTSLLEQWRQRLQQFLEIDEELPELLTKTGRKSTKKRSVVGRIGGGKNVPSGIIDVATPLSLFEEGEVAGEKRVKDLVRTYGMVICDECHHVPSLSYLQVLRSAAARFVYGMTATPMRRDGLEPILFMQCGPVRYKFDGKAQAALQSFNRVLVPRFTKFRLPEADCKHGEEVGGRASCQGESFAALIDAVCADTDRTRFIAEDAAALVEKGRIPLVLTRRVQHAKALGDCLSRLGVRSVLLVGSDSTAERARKMADFKNIPAEERFAVVATGDYMGEGFDDDRFDAMLLATPVSWKGLIVQYAGRLHREHEGKQEVLIYDYVDARVPMFDAMYRKRLKEYAALAYEVRMMEQEEGAVAEFFDGKTQTKRFAKDIEEAQSSVSIQSPFASPRKVALLENALHSAVGRGVVVHIRVENLGEVSRYRKDAENAIAALEGCGCVVEAVSDKMTNVTVIDEKIVWYGEVNHLSFNKSDAMCLRFESVAVAQELAGGLLNIQSE